MSDVNIPSADQTQLGSATFEQTGVLHGNWTDWTMSTTGPEQLSDNSTNPVNVILGPISVIGMAGAPPPVRTCMVYDLITEAVIMSLLCLFGFVGNTLSVMCLWQDRSRSATPLLLISLEAADTLFLVAVLILRVLTSIHTYTGWFTALMSVFPYVGKYVFPVALQAETGTIYLTMLVTFNRYVSVCRPYEASSLCSVQHARRHIVGVVIFSILYNIPRFLEFEVGVHEEPSKNRTILVSRLSDIGKHKIYQILYGNALYFLVMFLVPLATLIILNYKLIKALKDTKRKREQLLNHNHPSKQLQPATTRNSGSGPSGGSAKNEDDITFMLIVVVVVFVICQTPALVTQVLLSLLSINYRRCPSFFFYYERLSDLMVVANSALNFLIYCFCSKRFRQTLVKVVFGGKNRSGSIGGGTTHLALPQTEPSRRHS